MSTVLITPSTKLREQTREITRIDKKLLDLIEDMKQTLIEAKNPEGVGLAAPQIGVPLKIFLMRPTKKDPITIFINPKITQLSKVVQTPLHKEGAKDSHDAVYEGCLSIPHHYAPITRSYEVTVEYQTPQLANGNWQLANKSDHFVGFPAHIIQHEVDHLNGTLFIDLVLSQKVPVYKITGKNWVEVKL